MARKTINYKNTIIYKIVCKDVKVNDVYVGYTTDFTRRKSEHKKACLNINSKSYYFFVYEIIRKNGNWENWDMIEIMKYSCNDSNEAKAKERYYIETLQATLNKVIPLRTAAEYRTNNKEKIKIKDHGYHLKNKEKINEKHRQYRKNKPKANKNNCGCGGCFTDEHKAEHLKTKKHQQFMNII